MITVDVVRLPRELNHQQHILGRAVVVFDVLRATTSMVTALAAGASEVRVFDSLDAASQAAKQSAIPEKLLCGERNCLRPEGFDLGNSPSDFVGERVKGKTIFLSTTNGTRAIVAAHGAARLMVAALVNAQATANSLISLNRNVTLLCAGTNGEYAPEDMIGAGAVAAAMSDVEMTPSTIEAVRLFLDSRSDLTHALRNTQGGRNIVQAGLEQDIALAAGLNALDISVEVSGDSPIARRMIGK